MIRILIVAAAVALVLGGLGAAFSGARDQDPGPAIVLDEAPIDDDKSARDKHGADNAADGAKDGGGAAAGSGGNHSGKSFTVVHPQPVEADDDSDDADEPDEPDGADDSDDSDDD